MEGTVEVTKRVPVVAEVDVLVAGAGIAGCCAAVAAARNGARTMLVDRFGILGGNVGPGMMSGGVVHLALGYPQAMMGGLKGIPGEFLNRCEGYADGQMGHQHLRDSQVASYVWLRMMEENRVRLLLNTYVADPIMEGNRVVGVMVENKSGSQAILAGVVIDATADADVAMRAGAPVDEGENYVHPGMHFTVAGVDTGRFMGWLRGEHRIDPQDLAWAEEIFTRHFGSPVPRLNPLIPFYKRAWELGEYWIIKDIDGIASVSLDHGIPHSPNEYFGPRDGLVSTQVGLRGKGIRSGDQAMMSRLEAGSRLYIFETAQFLRRYVPGFEQSYLLVVSPYFHTRGGRGIVAEHATTMEDMAVGRRFDDVIFVHYPDQRQPRVEGGADFPYRQLLPQKVEGLLCAGLSAILQPPSMRNRWKCLMMGQAAGLAAAMAARDGVTPRDIDIKELQRTLVHRYQAYLGDGERLRELGVAEA
ncbi:MAG: FAD-dependent oxidoreductase [Anaerolineae bacterium]|nr:FAD-dependent oxidoreductase [Anaerolineae bacterium]